MLVAALVVLGVGHFGSVSVELASAPAGASVEVDGHRAPGVTPMLISNLSADRDHEIRVFLRGMRSWRQIIVPAHGATVRVQAELEPLPSHADGDL
jgi:hypothetical protein